MRSMPRLFGPRKAAHVVGDERGVTIVEFALVAPVLLLSIMGLLDIGHQYYAESILEGEMQKAARQSSFEDATTAAAQVAIDSQVATSVRRVIGTAANISFSRKAYNTYRRASVKTEDFVDNNANGLCDNGEPFEDADGNGVWSSDASILAPGGSKDVLIYSVSASYRRLFPMASMLGWSQNVTINATTMLKNQPVTNQREATTGNCT
jgi:Flp pilus assembly protein TadG